MVKERNEAEELARPYHRPREAKFVKRIAEFKIPPKIKMPSNVKMYDETQDPDDHLSIFVN